MTPFTHLHVHTQYSLLDGAARISDLVKRAKEIGQTSLAITDHGNMYGVIEFYKACKDAGIKPIIGMEAYVAPKSRFDKNGTQDRENAHLVLLAKNETGYKNLMFLSSEAFLHGFYYKPRIDYDLLSQHAEGLICLSACLAGDIPQALLAGDYAQARSIASRLKDLFSDDFYIELQNHGIDEQLRILPQLKKLAHELNVQTVITNDVHYVMHEDAEAQDVLLCIQTQRYIDETNRMRMESDQFYLKSGDEISALFPEDSDSVRITQDIADKCDLEIKFGIRRLPKYFVPDGFTNETYLRYLCDKGMQNKLPQANSEYHQRLEYELGVIANMGFIDYFLIVWDYIHFAKSHGIVVGPGRGSGAGSLVAYCLDITDVNPIKYGLLFERFLNPERVSMPDIDIDFCYERRQEVIDYVSQKYGDGRVAQIITFGTMAAKQALRDVARVLRIPYGDADKLAKLVPSALNISLTQSLQISTELRSLYETDDTMHRVIDLALKLEGLPRQSGTHAAGVIISAVPITDVVPLQVNDTVITTQFAGPTLEELGMLKMDFLGLRTLTVIRDAIDFIEKSGKKMPDLNSQSFNDPAVYQMITSGDTDGVFQLESPGMRQFLAQLKPDCFEDIIAGISLYRPGPMDQIPRYVQGKRNPNAVQYAHPLLKPILENTYGCMVYQEQVMEIVRSLAGYSYGRSDMVRRAMAKKKPEVMEKERKFFIHGTEGVDGAVKRGVSEDISNRIFDEMMDFASYAFNKSHAAAYAVLAYRTAYLKHYYPVEFMTALINSFMGNADKVAEYVYSAQRQGIRVLPPDINHSFTRFSVENENIRFGLAAVRNVGSSAMNEVVRERTENGPYSDFFDFCDRASGFNKRMLEALISTGCFDYSGANRAQLLAIYEQVFDSAAATKKVRESGQLSLFDQLGVSESHAIKINLPNIDEMPKQQLLAREREALGMYYSGHPLDSFRNILTSLPYSVSDLQSADGSTGIGDNAEVTVGGMFTDCKQKPTKSNSGLMGYATLEGMPGSVECVLFPRTLQQYASLFYEDSPVWVRGKLNIREDRANSLLIDELRRLDTAVSKTLYIRFPVLTEDNMSRAINFLKGHPGETRVILIDAAKRIQRIAPKNYFVTADTATVTEAEKLFGKDNVKCL